MKDLTTSLTTKTWKSNWKVFEIGACIIQHRYIHRYENPHQHVKKIISMDVKHLRYEWVSWSPDKRKTTGFIYFGESENYLLVDEYMLKFFKLILL